MANSLARISSARSPLLRPRQLEHPFLQPLVPQHKSIAIPSAEFSIGPLVASERQTNARSADPRRSPPSPAPPNDQTRSACPSLPPPARCVIVAPPPRHRPAPANSAAHSCRALHHPHQHPHLLGVKSPPYPQTPPILAQNFHSPVPSPAARRSPDTRARSPPPSLPQISSSACTAPQGPPPAAASSTSRNVTAQLALPAKHRHALSTPPLLGNQLLPLPSCFPAPFPLRHRASSLTAGYSAPAPLSPTRCASHIAHNIVERISI